MTDDEIDTETVRQALEAAYRRKADEDVNKFELYAYASKLPDGTPEDVGMSIAAEVVADPPELEAEGRGNSSTDGLSDATIADHYHRVEDVYAELGEIDGDLCPASTDFVGWYHTRPADGEYDGEGRVWGLGREFPGMRDELDRVLYSSINYAPGSWFLNAWRRFKYNDDGRSWADDVTPTPGYGDITAYAPFADIDLNDDVKHDRPTGDIPTERIEAALEGYVDAFAELAGGTDHVFVLDSVGGAYVMIAPTSTAPIADRYDRGGRALLFEDLVDRMNDWLDNTRESINDRVDVAGVFEPDLLNNKNRLYKAPMSVHSSLPGAVTPIDPGDVRYEYTPVETVSERDISRSEDWAAEYTADHSGALTPIVRALWPSYWDDSDGWTEALDDRLDDLKTEAEANKEREASRLSAEDVPDDLETTDDIEEINAVIEGINVKHLARDVASEFDTDPGRDPPRFDPSWRSSSSGTSCYADRDKFVDLKEGRKGGGPLKLIARDRRIITHCRQSLEGDDYWRAVAELRKEGYDIPRFTGSDGLHPDALELYDGDDDGEERKRKALRALRASKRQ